MIEHLRFRQVTSMLRKAVVNFPLNGDSEIKVDDDWDERVVKDVTTFDEANAISSEYVHLYKGKHALLLDLDVEHVYVPSSSPYHGHLVIGVQLEQEQVQEILNILGKYGILQGGFVSAARFRKAAWLRTPWSKKWGGE